MKRFLSAAAILVLVSMAVPSFATAYDLRASGESSATVMPRQIGVREFILDFSKHSLTSSDYAKLMTIPAGTTVLNVQLYVDDATTAATTLDVGDSADTDGYLDGVSNGTADASFQSFVPDNQKVWQTFTFFDEDVSANQSAAAWGNSVGSTAGGIVVPYAGSVRAITVISNAACTSGTLTADATVDGTATGLQAGLNSVDDTLTSRATQAWAADTFTAGQAIGCKVTTSDVWAPTTADVAAAVTVEYNTGTANAYSGGKYYSSADYLRIAPAATCSNGKVTVRMVYIKP